MASENVWVFELCKAAMTVMAVHAPVDIVDGVQE